MTDKTKRECCDSFGPPDGISDGDKTESTNHEENCPFVWSVRQSFFKDYERARSAPTSENLRMKALSHSNGSQKFE